MPYIGRELDSGNYLKLDDISSSFNGSTTTFNLTAAGKAFFPGSAFSILVNLAGVAQEPESAYQTNNATITFATAPVAGDQFFCIVLGVAHGVNVPGNGTVNGAQLAKPFNYDGYFYLDDANNRVGVGTLTPAKPLHVVGEGQFDSVRVLGDLTVDGTTTTLDTVVTEVDRLEVGANNNTVGLAVTQSGSGDAAIFMGGSVGIGTDNPNRLLTVKRRDSAGAYAEMGASQDGGIRGLQFRSADNGVYKGAIHTLDATSSGGMIALATGGAEKLRITSTGLVGIGLTNPFGKLQVRPGTNANFSFTTGGGESSLELINDAGSANVPLNVRASEYKIKIQGTEFIRINSAGSVGIGTNSPQSQFEVYGTSPIVRSKHSTSQKYTQINHNGTDGYVDWSSGNLILRGASNVEKLRITSAGKIGIGTDNPGHNLHVHGSFPDFAISDSDTTNDKFRILHNGGGTQLQVDPNNVGPNVSYLLATIDGTERLRINSYGTLGVGCVPNDIQDNFDAVQIGGNLILNVDSTGVGAGVYMSNNVYRDRTNSRWEYINTDESTQYVQANGEHIWRYAASGSADSAITWSEALRITSGGKIGIGAYNNTAYDTNAQNVLIASDGNTGITIRSAGSTPFAMIHFADGTTGNSQKRAGRIVYQHDGDNLMFNTANEERIRITGGGTILAGGQSSSYDGGFVNLELRKDSNTVGGSMTLVNDTASQAGATCEIDCYQNYRGSGKIVFGRENANNWQSSAGGAASFLAFHTNNAGTVAEKLRIASDGVITINTVPATNNNANQAVLFQTAAGAIHGGSGLLYNPGEDALKVNGNIINSNAFLGAGAGPLLLAVANYSSTQYIKVSNKIEIKGNVGINQATPAVSLDLASNTDAVSLPTGTTAQRPAGTDAYIRKNSTNNALEFYNGTNWVEIITDYFPTGSTTLG